MTLNQSAQEQDARPGHESEMFPQPRSDDRGYRGSGKLKNKVALITGGDSGIGRAVAIYFAREGADCSIVYLDEHDDVRETKRRVEREGRRCLLIAADIGHETVCQEAVRRTIDEFGRLDILVNNAAEARRSTRGGRALLRFPGVGRLFVHDGAGPPPQWGKGCQRMIRGGPRLIDFRGIGFA
jgi:NAD(P)-dependent dehydrogenase (short-subunit alcohol dehydrogenase family)